MTKISFRQNYLLIDRSAINPELVTPADLETILKTGRQAILSGINEFYLKTKAANPNATVVHPSINLFSLGLDTKKEPSLTDLGRSNNTGIFSSILEIDARWHEYWRAIEHADFIPEARRYTYSKLHDNHGLLFRDEPLT